MRYHLLRLLQIPAIGQVNRDPGRSKRVTADFRLDAGLSRAPADHVEGVLPVKRPLWQHATLLHGYANSMKRLDNSESVNLHKCLILLDSCQIHATRYLHAAIASGVNQTVRLP